MQEGELRNALGSSRDGCEEPLRPARGKVRWPEPRLYAPGACICSPEPCPLCAHTVHPTFKAGFPCRCPSAFPDTRDVCGHTQGPPQLPCEDIAGQWHLGTISGDSNEPDSRGLPTAMALRVWVGLSRNRRVVGRGDRAHRRVYLLERWPDSPRKP